MKYDDVDVDGFVSFLWNIRPGDFQSLYRQYMVYCGKTEKEMRELFK